MDTNTKLIFSTVFTSFFTFQLLFHFISYWFSAKVSPGFNSLSFEKKIEWNSRVVSTCHSLVAGIFALYIFFFDEAAKADPLWGDSSFVKVNISISSGYLISDKDGVLAYIGNFRLLAELSSPFVNQRWFFEALKYPKFSKANVINGILMTVVFFIVRIVSMPPFYSYIYSVLGTEAYIRLGFLTQCSWISTCIVLDVMNVMWMIKITKGCVKVISLIRQEKAKSSLQNGKLD
ncbi:TLC domain-containing protein 4 [Prionailurus iriomotensis]